MQKKRLSKPCQEVCSPQSQRHVRFARKTFTSRPKVMTLLQHIKMNLRAD